MNRSSHRLFQSIIDCLKPRQRLLVQTLCMVILLNLLDLTIPKCLQLFVDSFMGNPLKLGRIPLDFMGTPRGQMLILPVLLVTLAFGRWATTFGRAVLESRLAQGALFDLRSRIFSTMQSLSFAYHDKTHAGLLISHVVEDVNYTSRFLQSGMFPLLECCVYIVAAYVIMAWISVPVALVSALMLASSFLAVAAYFRYGQAFFARTKALFADTVQLFTENMEGHHIVRAFAARSRQSEIYRRRVNTMHDAILTETYLSTLMSQAMVWANALGLAAVLAISLLLYQRGTPDLTLGKIFMLFYIQRSLVPRTRMLGRSFDLLMRFKITADRLEDILFGSDSYLPDEGVRPLPSAGPGSLELRKVSFQYPDGPRALRDISIAVEAGSTIALVGATGSGKTTLAMLLTRFYDPTAGSILLDGSDIRDFPVQQLRNQFSLAFQESFLFSTSIRDNIAYGKPDAPLEDLVYAATLAQAHEFIMATPDGYDTVVGERGVTLSGGQRQRISIARAILQRPRFLVLDACTAAVDGLTEKAIQAGLNALKKDSTIIIIAQRFSSVEHADRVCVFEDGRLVEDGTPAALNRPGTIFTRILDIPEDP